MNPRHTTSPRSRRGYTLIEALLMIIILSIISIPVGNAMIAAARTTEGNENTLALDSALVSQMEKLRATYQNYTSVITAATPYTSTSTVAIGNASYTVNTTIQEWDPLPDPNNNAGETDPGLKNNFLRLTVTMAGRTINSFVSY